MRLCCFLLLLVFLSCSESRVLNQIVGDWKAVSFEASECYENFVNGIPFNEIDNNDCLQTVYGFICELEFEINSEEDATLRYKDESGLLVEVPYNYFQVGDSDLVSIFPKPLPSGIAWVAKIEKRKLVLTDNGFQICDEFDIRFKRK